MQQRYTPALGMDKQRLEDLALRTLMPLEQLPYEEARQRALAKRVDVEDRVDEGVQFQIEIQYFFDSGRSGPVRILVSVDDGGWRSFMPLTRSMLISERQT